MAERSRTVPIQFGARLATKMPSRAPRSALLWDLAIVDLSREIPGAGAATMLAGREQSVFSDAECVFRSAAKFFEHVRKCLSRHLEGVSEAHRRPTEAPNHFLDNLCRTALIGIL